jgi:hypothetical protein
LEMFTFTAAGGSVDLLDFERHGPFVMVIR